MNRLFGDVGEGVISSWRESWSINTAEKVDIHAIAAKESCGYI